MVQIQLCAPDDGRRYHPKHVEQFPDINCVTVRLVGNTGLFISPSGISELDCTTTKTDTAERSISIGRESLQVFSCTRGLGVLPGSTARGVVVKKNGVHSE